MAGRPGPGSFIGLRGDAGSGDRVPAAGGKDRPGRRHHGCARLPADEQRPTAAEKALIAAWVRARDGCWRDGAPWRSDHLPAPLVSLLSVFEAVFLALCADLHAGRIGYGDYARARIAASAEVDAAWQSIAADINRDEAATAAAVEERRRQAVATLLALPQTGRRPPAAGIARCLTASIGADTYTTCF